MFTKRSKEGKITNISVYIDDLISLEIVIMSKFKSSMLREFGMSDLGKMRFFLGIEVLQKFDGIYICERKYTLEVLKKFGMLDSNSVGSLIVSGFKIKREESGNFVDGAYYKQLAGSLMYHTTTRLDMMFVTCLIGRYMVKSMQIHLQITKKALWYLKGTMNYGIHYKRRRDGELLAFIDKNYAINMDRKSTSGYVLLMSSSAVSWC